MADIAIPLRSALIRLAHANPEDIRRHLLPLLKNAGTIGGDLLMGDAKTVAIAFDKDDDNKVIAAAKKLLKTLWAILKDVDNDQGLAAKVKRLY